jgi:thiol-disulfide isomerase/thioredoxin
VRLDLAGERSVLAFANRNHDDSTQRETVSDDGLVKTVLALLLMVVLVGCGEPQTPDTAADPAAGPVSAAPSPTASRSSTTPSGSTSPTAAPSPVSSTAASAPVPQTLDFTGTTVDGTSLRGSSLAGKPVLFWFWAPWCPTCRSQIPQVEGLADEYGPDLAVVGVGSPDSADAIQDFADETPGMTQLSDPDGALWRHFGIAEQSSYVLLDATGKQVLKSGYGGHADLEQRVADVVR